MFKKKKYATIPMCSIKSSKSLDEKDENKKIKCQEGPLKKVKI